MENSSYLYKICTITTMTFIIMCTICQSGTILSKCIDLYKLFEEIKTGPEIWILPW